MHLLIVEKSVQAGKGYQHKEFKTDPIKEHNLLEPQKGGEDFHNSIVRQKVSVRREVNCSEVLRMEEVASDTVEKTTKNNAL